MSVPSRCFGAREDALDRGLDQLGGFRRLGDLVREDLGHARLQELAPVAVEQSPTGLGLHVSAADEQVRQRHGGTHGEVQGRMVLGGPDVHEFAAQASFLGGHPRFLVAEHERQSVLARLGEPSRQSRRCRLPRTRAVNPTE